MADDNTRISETEIAVHWHEEEYYSPPESFIQQANFRDADALRKFELDNFPDYFAEYGHLLQWDRPWDQVFDGSNPPFWKWFVGGKLNASVNCIDRHLAKNRNKTAFYFIPERPEEPKQVVTYQDLFVRVNEFAALLRDLGVKQGDRVTIHLPMVVELPVAMLACARLGAIHSVVFGGFSRQACAETDASCLMGYGGTTPLIRTLTMCPKIITLKVNGKTTTCIPNICPALGKLTHANPKAFKPSLACTAFH